MKELLISNCSVLETSLGLANPLLPTSVDVVLVFNRNRHPLALATSTKTEAVQLSRNFALSSLHVAIRKSPRQLVHLAELSHMAIARSSMGVET